MTTTTTDSTTDIYWFEPCICCSKQIRAVRDKDCGEVFTWCEHCQMTRLSRYVQFTSGGCVSSDSERDTDWSDYCPVHPDRTQDVLI